MNWIVTHSDRESGPEKPFEGQRRLGRILLSGVVWLASCTLLLAEPARLGSPLPPSLSASDEALLNDIQVRALLYFAEQTDRTTGLTLDRAPADGGQSHAYASVAASGFAITGWCIAAERGWLSRDLARRQTARTLGFLLSATDHAKGWFYHFVGGRDGRRAWNSEASTIDTALLLQGAILAREYFQDPEINALCNALYRRIDWRWALNNGDTLSHGWRPESGFIKHRWSDYAEMTGLYLLGLGAPENALPPAAWHAWKRSPIIEYAGRPFIQGGPLFVHQYSHAWFDFRDKHDDYADYWQNSVEATLAHRQWSADHGSRFPSWSLDVWGLSASDSAQGYVAWGGPGMPDRSDGTLVPCAPGGSLPFAPRECLTALREMKHRWGASIWKRYGFVDAFNPHNGWVGKDVLAIDQGIMLIMAENLRSGFVWNTFMRAPEVLRAMQIAGFLSTLPARPLLAQNP